MQKLRFRFCHAARVLPEVREMKILSDEEIMAHAWNADIDFGRAVEAEVVTKLKEKADRLIAAHRNAIYRGDLAKLFEEEA
jgi:hypothetical protein